MLPRLPPPFLHTASDQKLDGGKAWNEARTCGQLDFPGSYSYETNPPNLLPSKLHFMLSCFPPVNCNVQSSLPSTVVPSTSSRPAGGRTPAARMLPW